MSSLDQTTVEHIYQNWAKVYEWLTPIYLLGNEEAPSSRNDRFPVLAAWSNSSRGGLRYGTKLFDDP